MKNPGRKKVCKAMLKKPESTTVDWAPPTRRGKPLRKLKQSDLKTIKLIRKMIYPPSTDIVRPVVATSSPQSSTPTSIGVVPSVTTKASINYPKLRCPHTDLYNKYANPKAGLCHSLPTIICRYCGSVLKRHEKKQRYMQCKMK